MNLTKYLAKNRAALERPSGPGRSVSGYGLDYEMGIGPAAAQALLPTGANLPRMGYEVDIRVNRSSDPFVLHRSVTGRLTLQNVSGTLILASSSHLRSHWNAAFSQPTA